MCGIAGIYRYKDKNDAKYRLNTMVESLRHRGPDEIGEYSDSEVLLGHTRLSIVDIESGSQPIFNEDRSIVVIFNGEIFNYKELRYELVAKGHIFKTNSDTEVIVHLYEEYHHNFPEYLNGQFSIVLWDTNKQDLILCRDRYGITPLFYQLNDGEIIFSSEIKALAKTSKNSLSIDPDSLSQIFTFWTVLPPRSIFKGIFQVPPGSLMLIHKGAIKSEKKYWAFDFPEKQNLIRLSGSLLDQIEDEFANSVDIRLRADVPVGSYLSGGLDSSILAYQASLKMQESISTFSVTFSQDEFDESQYQNEFSSYSKIKRSSVNIRNEDIESNFFDALFHMESPILRTAPVPMSILSRHAHDSGYKVVLTGEGADEVFGGYDLFKEAKIRYFWSKHPTSNIRPSLFKKMYPYLLENGTKAFDYLKRFYAVGLDDAEQAFFSHLPRWKTTEKCKFFLSEEFKASVTSNPLQELDSILPESFHKWHYLNKAQYLEVVTLMSGYLLSSQGDRVLMMNSLEGRFPFLDHNLSDLMNKIDPRDKIQGLNEKAILKKIATGKIPVQIVNRSKQPYRAPDSQCFDIKQGFTEHLLSNDMIKKYGIFDYKKVEMMKRKLAFGRLTSVADNQAFVGVLSTQAICHFYC